MTFDEFIDKHLGRAVDYDGAAGRQCVDLVEAYFDEVFGSGVKNFWFDAKHFYTLFNSNKWLVDNMVRIPNTPEFVPQKGDVMVWGGDLSAGGWGHIAVCNGKGTTEWFESYDQNWTGNQDPCTLIRHNYRAVLGVLRPKDQGKIYPLPAGDVNGDGKVTVTDVSKVVAHIKGVKSLSKGEASRADINHDGRIDVSDAAVIAKKVKGKK